MNWGFVGCIYGVFELNFGDPGDIFELVLDRSLKMLNWILVVLEFSEMKFKEVDCFWNEF